MSEQNKARELRALAEAVKQWGSVNQALQLFAEEVPETAAVGAHIDGEFCPVVTVDCDQYYREEDSLKLAKFYAAANPAAILELLDERDELLAALKRQVEHFDGMEVDEIEEECGLDTAQRVDVARAAIQKAEGSRNEQGA